MGCLKKLGFSVFTSTLFMATTCWKLLLLGNQLMTADVEVTFKAFTQLGAKGMSMVKNKYIMFFHMYIYM